MAILAVPSLITTVGLLILTVRLRLHAPWAPHPKRLFGGMIVGLASSALLAISCSMGTIWAPLTHVLNSLVLPANVANIACGIVVLWEFTAEGLIAAFLIATNQVLWILFVIWSLPEF